MGELRLSAASSIVRIKRIESSLTLITLAAPVVSLVLLVPNRI